MSAQPTAATPKYTHDCDRCIYLGEGDGADLYYCPQKVTFPTVIARYSNEGSDYISGMALADLGIQPLARAKELAVARELKV